MGGEGGRKVGSKSFNHSSKNRQFCCADVTDECLVSRKKKKKKECLKQGNTIQTFKKF